MSSCLNHLQSFLDLILVISSRGSYISSLAIQKELNNTVSFKKDLALWSRSKIHDPFDIIMIYSL